jgi:hypothetical protein
LNELISGKTSPIFIIQKALDKEIVDEEVNKSIVFFAGMSSKLKNYSDFLLQLMPNLLEKKVFGE